MTTLRGRQMRQWCADVGASGSITIYAQPADAESARGIEYTMNFAPTGGSDYEAGVMAPDWHNKRIFYTYMDKTATPATVVKWWDGKSSGSALGTAITTIGGYWIDGLAADPDNEHLYFTGKADPYPFTYPGVDFSVDLKRMDYDGSNITTLDTMPVFEAGGSGGAIGRPGVGCMMVHREQQRLYYVKRENVTPSSPNENTIGIYYRDFANITTEVEVYNIPCFSAFISGLAIRLIDGLSFDVAGGKIYWCEHSQDGSGNSIGNVKRADLDGANLETLYTSAAPYAINFARYSNTLKKILHEDFDADPTPPRDGYYLRDDAFALLKQYGKSATPETTGSPFPGPTGSFLWCGFEDTGSGLKP